jgi:hypothetical protein
VDYLPTRRGHLKFDEYLREHGVIREDTNTDAVHNRMDKDLQVYGHWNHQYEDYYHHPNGIRDWIRKWSHLGYQDTLTDYVRAALGHLVLDEMWSKYKFESEEELMKTAYRSLCSKRLWEMLFQRMKALELTSISLFKTV